MLKRLHNTQHPIIKLLKVRRMALNKKAPKKIKQVRTNKIIRRFKIKRTIKLPTTVTHFKVGQNAQHLNTNDLKSNNTTKKP